MVLKIILSKFFMKTCDICSKTTNFLEDLDYCMVCSDCYIEITTEESEINKYLNEDKENDNRDNE